VSFEKKSPYVFEKKAVCFRPKLGVNFGGRKGDWEEKESSIQLLLILMIDKWGINIA